MRANKKRLVLNHLVQYGNITSMQAIELYGATRLAAIIFELRKDGYRIITKGMSIKDKNGDICTFAKYVLDNRE